MTEYNLNKMKKNVALLILLLTLCFAVKAQTASSDVSLLTLQCKSGESICHTQEIVRYDFKNGEFVSKETILSLPTEKGRFDLGNQLYQDRYLISDSGTIFDIQTKQVLGDNRGWLVDVVGNDVIYEVNKVDLEGVFAFDLNTKEYRKMPADNVFESEGVLSPDKKRFGVMRGSFIAKGEFQFHEIENWKSKKVKKVSGSFSASCSNRCSDNSGKVSFIWLDNETILTQSSNGEIVTVNIDGKIEPIVTIKLDDEPDSLPSFSKDEYGNISYYCDGTDYLIDVKNKKVVKDKAVLGNDFESVDGKAFWSEYFYKGKSIGRIWSGGSANYKGFLVVNYAKEGKNLGYPDGIKVWNDLKKDWITIEVNWGVQIIGWLEK